METIIGGECKPGGVTGLEQGRVAAGGGGHVYAGQAGLGFRRKRGLGTGWAGTCAWKGRAGVVMGGTVLEIGLESAPGCVVLRLVGELDLTTVDRLWAAVAEALAVAGARVVVLDFGSLSFCDSSGLGALVAGWKLARAAGVRLVLVRVAGLCRRILARTGLERVFEVFDTVEQAAAVPG